MATYFSNERPRWHGALLLRMQQTSCRRSAGPFLPLARHDSSRLMAMCRALAPHGWCFTRRGVQAQRCVARNGPCNTSSVCRRRTVGCAGAKRRRSQCAAPTGKRRPHVRSSSAGGEGQARAVAASRLHMRRFMRVAAPVYRDRIAPNFMYSDQLVHGRLDEGQVVDIAHRDLSTSPSANS